MIMTRTGGVFTYCIINLRDFDEKEIINAVGLKDLESKN